VKKRGTGYGTGWQGANYHFGYPDHSTVEIELTDDLRYRVGVAAADLGQGIPETTRVIVGEALGGVPPERIDVIDPDTTATPSGGSTGASRQTTMTGNATLGAARKLRRVLQMAASELLDTPPGEVAIREGVLVGREGRSVTLREVVDECREMSLPLKASATFEGEPTEPLDEDGQGYGVNQFSYATYIAEVEVDTDTGEVTVLRLDAFVDAGRIVRRIGAEMQVEGGVAIGLGHTLTEEFKQREGWPETSSLTTYLIPTVYDVPLAIHSDFVDEPVPMGDLGVKGMAELTVVPVAPAVISAIYDAVGVTITDLPATPERVLKALHAKARREREEGGAAHDG
jgi:CO/xanthine dehydrogenase Mo-binding subunit